MAEDITTEQDKKKLPNPNGKGGFADNPQNINPGGRPKNQESFTYWMRVFKEMTVEEYLAWDSETNDKEKTVAASLAYARVKKSRESLKEFKEVADRTEGKASQSLDITSGGKPLPILDALSKNNSNRQDTEAT